MVNEVKLKIDPTHLNSTKARYLAALFECLPYESMEIFEAGKLYNFTIKSKRDTKIIETSVTIELTAHILRRLSKHADKNGTFDLKKQRFDVYDASTSFAEGGFGAIHHSQGTLIPTEKGVLFNEKSPDKKRVIKTLIDKEYDNLDNEMELSFNQKSLHSKRGVRQSNASAISLRALGVDLKTYLSQHKDLSTQEKIQLSRDILHAVNEQVVKKGLCHMDLKPANIMIDASDGSRPPKVVIIDFGLAVKKTQQKVSPRGTPYYSPPDGDHKTADAFALGQIFAEVFGLDSIHKKIKGYRLIAIKKVESTYGLSNKIQAIKHIDEMMLELYRDEIMNSLNSDGIEQAIAKLITKNMSCNSSNDRKDIPTLLTEVEDIANENKIKLEVPTSDSKKPITDEQLKEIKTSVIKKLKLYVKKNEKRLFKNFKLSKIKKDVILELITKIENAPNLKIMGKALKAAKKSNVDSEITHNKDYARDKKSRMGETLDNIQHKIIGPRAK